MYCVTTQKSRHLVGALTRGMELPAAFDRIFSDNLARSGNIRLGGVLEHAVLLTESGTPLTILQQSRILSCEGTISDTDGRIEAFLTVCLQFSGPLGPQIVGGTLKEARILACEFDLVVFDDILIVKKTDPRLPIPVWTDCFAESEENVTGSGPLPGPDRESEEPSSDSSLLPGPGDIVEHFRFGTCRVQKVDNGESLEVWLPSKNKARLSMQVLQFTLERTEEDGTNVFRAKPHKTR